MKADLRFTNQPLSFWAHVRIISQQVGYTERIKRRDRVAKGAKAKGAGRATGPVRVPTLSEMKEALEGIGLSSGHIVDGEDRPTDFGERLLAYFVHRADVLNGFVKDRLMDVRSARKLFNDYRAKLKPRCPIPMNKQKGKKKAPAYFTGIINMLIEAHAQGLPCNYNPLELTTVTFGGVPLRTLARRIDGAFPSPVNPISVWEIKEYYYTTTFGSRVADGVYETLLDGMELQELREHERIDVKHYLMVDDYFTWWDCGRSYLCRIVDMVHMGYVDEVLFGREVAERMPAIVNEWVQIAKERGELATTRKRGGKPEKGA